MEFSIKSGNPEKQQSGCVIVGVFESRKLSAAASAIDAAANGYLSSILDHGDMDGKLASSLVLHRVPGTQSDRVLLVGLGKDEDFGEAEYRQAVRASVNALANSGASETASFLAELPVKQHDTAWKVAQLTEAVLDSAYRFDRMKGKASKENNGQQAKKGISRCIVSVPANDVSKAEAALKQGQAIAAGVNFTKDLGNLPPNVCTPTYLAEQAQKLAQDYGLQVQVLERAELEKLGMGSFLGVAQGSEQPPKLIVLQHNKGGKGQKPVVLVGKGITFDSGGISIKPASDMDEMKYDMCGAASVLGTFRAIAEMDLPLNVVGIVPTCENMPDGNSVRPGDVLTSLSGQTIEVLNTDAEGRLILCDALTYAERF
ncbi:MAG TPA: leucyl aminopeptidase, partial [Oxalicibacterium sp.]|nr:leucyl aminopeptidase [Oxalicibacterium sp.]